MSQSRKHHYSQHFLKSPKVALMLIGHSNIRRKDTVLDIGAGSGVFTFALSKRSTRVIAIEKDKQAFKKLSLNLKNIQNVKLINKDFLNFNLENLPVKYKVCSNIPFSLSSKIIQKLVNSNNKPQAIYLILQKQFAQKLIIDKNNFTSALGVKFMPFYSAKIRKPLHKNDFTPPPAVDTVFMELKKREEPLITLEDKNNYNSFIDKCFASSNFFKKYNKNKEKKPSELTSQQWLTIWQNYNKKG